MENNNLINAGAILLASGISAFAEKSLSAYSFSPLTALSLASVAAAESLELTVHTEKTVKTVSTGIYGQFLEHIFNSVHGGLWGDQILNFTLELRPRPRRRGRPGADSAPTNAPAVLGICRRHQ
jgi:hypothetical protein